VPAAEALGLTRLWIVPPVFGKFAARISITMTSEQHAVQISIVNSSIFYFSG
jgi:hypothetical protein